MSAPFADWTPPEHPGTFEIGLVLAGATSAGCYTAGVVDYLIEALEKFEHSKANPDGPQHNVRIRVIAGASAVAEPLDVVITLTNLRGVPYRFQTVPSDVTSNFELMSMHSDYVRFAMRSHANTSVAPDAVVLNPAKIGKAD